MINNRRLNSARKAAAYANANIALVKYWGKAEGMLNIPAVSSLSMTLNDLGTEVFLEPCLKHHEILISGEKAPQLIEERVTSYLEHLRRMYAFSDFLRLDSKSTVPIKAGLASSAAFFAATAKAFDQAFSLNLDDKNLSLLARLGSGSAARSIFPRFAALLGHESLAHEDAYAYPVENHESLDLHLIVAIVDDQPKPFSSREAMNHTTKTSPLYRAFVHSHEEDFRAAIVALKDGDFTKLGSIMEHSTLKMFATMWSARPAINFWQPSSLALINLVYQLRSLHGPVAFFTMDAGPNVKILCQGQNLPLVLKAVAETGLTRSLFCATPGSGAIGKN
jgi:diphosphomevalonate decarboxylase